MIYGYSAIGRLRKIHPKGAGTYRVPYYRLTPIAVTAANMDERVIRDGFYLREDVYRNVLPQGE
jgi:D-xylose transport system substrate-binding protein